MDAAWADIGWDKAYSAEFGDPTATRLTLSSRLDWYASARARTGLIVDNLLLYVTGGIAYANLSHTFTVTDDGSTPPLERFSADRGRWGGVIGVGTEWAWSPNWSIKSEFLYYRFQQETTSGISPNGSPDPVHFDNNDSMWVSRIGLNYRWGGR